VVSCALKPFEGTPAPPPGPTDPAQLWVEPRNLEGRDLFYGIGGEKYAPEPAGIFRFDREKENIWASSPGLRVHDRNGRKWNVKLGAETRPEVFASRVIWALGYHQPPVYYLPTWTLERDDKQSEQPSGRFRPKLKHLDREGHWSWSDNPFIGTQAFRGLKVLMAFLNNWDLTVENTEIYELDEEWDGARRWYVVRDVGASISRNRGPLLQGTRGDIEGFEQQGFVRGVEQGRVQFDWNGPRAELFADLSPADVHWTCALLARIRPEQWDAALRAAGYAGEEAARLRKRIAERIAQGKNLG
jgi:hypothetical protein